MSVNPLPGQPGVDKNPAGDYYYRTDKEPGELVPGKNYPRRGSERGGP